MMIEKYDQKVNIPEIVFTMGLPGSGKSTWVKNNLHNYRVVCPDNIKESHSNYDPRRPELLHTWSQDVTQQLFMRITSACKGLWVIDGTGSNLEKMLWRIDKAKHSGYKVSLVYIRCNLEVALWRNANRRRTIPSSIIKSKDFKIKKNIEVLRKKASHIYTITQIF